jgi:hypothetical protein
MQNHICRLQPPRNAKLSGPMESLIYSLCPEDELITTDKLINIYIDKLTKLSKGEMRNYSNRHEDINNALDSLAKAGFIKEINGIRLIRFIQSF